MSAHSLQRDQRIKTALEIASQHGDIDGVHHKQWVIDQMVRALLGHSQDPHEYEAWVRGQKAGEDGPDTYGWEEGIPP